MLHLIAKVYLESERYLNSTALHSHFAYAKGSAHPVSELVNEDLGETACFFDELKAGFEDNEELFWQSVIQKSKHEDYIIYADPRLFRYLQLQFWKSIFPLANSEKIYWLYNCYRQNEKLTRLVREDFRDQNITFDKDHYPFIAKEKFITEYESIPVSTFFKACDKALMSFENLLIQYALDGDSIYASYLLKRIEDLSWNRWFNNVDSLKSHLLACPQQISMIVEGFKSSDEFSVIDALSAHPELKWISDSEFKQKNPDYVKSIYTYTLFEELAAKRDALDKLKFLNDGEWVDKPFRNFDQEVRSKLTFEGKFEELLQFDVQYGHGCYFLKGMSYFKSNHFLINQIYAYIRNEDTAALTGLSFEQGGYIESHP